MPPKTAGKPGGRSKKDMLQDESTEKVYRLYRKNLQAAGLAMPRKLVEKFIILRDEKTPGNLEELALWENIGPEGMKCLADALKEYDYKYLKEVHLWDAGIEDEGARSLSMYLMTAISMRTIEIVNSKISPLGCEFIGQIFGIGSRNFILSLKLDYNNFGDAGVELLSRGLRMNQTLFHLSLAFCGITGEGARFIMEIIINQQCQIKDLNLQGNCLRNQGVVILFRGLMINSSVVSVDLTDNQFGEEELVLTTLRDLVFTNKSVKILDFTHNGFYETGAQYILGFLTEKNDEGADIVYALNEIKLPEKISRDTLKAIEKAIKDNKKLRTKGKKKKKGKKKGKKKK